MVWIKINTQSEKINYYKTYGKDYFIWLDGIFGTAQ